MGEVEDQWRLAFRGLSSVETLELAYARRTPAELLGKSPSA